MSVIGYVLLSLLKLFLPYTGVENIRMHSENVVVAQMSIASSGAISIESGGSKKFVSTPKNYGSSNKIHIAYLLYKAKHYV